MGNASSKGGSGGSNNNNNKNSKGGNSSNDVKSSNVVERSKPSGMGTFSLGIGGDWTTYKDPSDKYSYPSNTTSNSGGGYKGGLGGQGGYSGSNSGQTKINPQVAKQITDKISSSESAIQNEIGRLKGLNPIASEETLRSAAIQFLGIATVEELRELEAYKIDQSKNIPSELLPYFASHSGKVIGWLEHQNKTLNLNFNIAGKDLDMSNKQITDENMLFFCQKMTSFTFHFDNLIISNNLMTNLSVQYLFNATLTSPTNRTIKNLDLRNNQIGDVGAELIAAYLKHGYMPATTHVKLADNIITDKGALCFAESLNSSVNKLKVLHLEGNNITKTGEGYLVKALLNKAVQHMVIYTQKLEQNSKLLPGIGTKEEKIAMYREYLKQGIEKGTNDQAIVVDKTFWGKIKHTGNQLDTAKIGIGGFIKCNWQPDEVIESYAQENFVAKISKTLGKILGKLNVVNGVTSCYLQATDEMYTSVPGQKVLTHKLSELEGNHELQVIGESEFSSDY